MYWPYGNRQLKNPNMLHIHMLMRQFSSSKILILGKNPNFWQHYIVCKLSQRNAIITYWLFCILNSKANLFFAGQNGLFYDRYRSYDSFVASITHVYEVDLQRSSGLSFEVETIVSFLWPQLPSFCLPSVLRSFRRLYRTHF